MKERYLLLTSILGSLIGLLALFILSQNIEYRDSGNNEIIAIKGEVTRINQRQNVTYLTITQPTDIDVIVFQNITLYKGESVEIIAKKDKEIIAKRIRII